MTSASSSPPTPQDVPFDTVGAVFICVNRETGRFTARPYGVFLEHQTLSTLKKQVAALVRERTPNKKALKVKWAEQDGGLLSRGPDDGDEVFVLAAVPTMGGFNVQYADGDTEHVQQHKPERYRAKLLEAHPANQEALDTFMDRDRAIRQEAGEKLKALALEFNTWLARSAQPFDPAGLPDEHLRGIKLR